MDKQKILVVVGPTASGKTALAIELAKIYNGEIISADSMQIYKGLDIATAKPTAAEMCEIPHHLIGFLNSDEKFSVADYLTLANEKIVEILSRQKLPIIAGGTGLYVSSLVDNIQFDDTVSDEKIRQRLYDEAKTKGNQFLLEKLKKIDEETAATLHQNNITRIIRALEYFEITGKKLSSQKILSKAVESPYEFTIIGLNFLDRKELYDRIDERVEIMLKTGLINEVKTVYESQNLKTAHQAIGYKELIPYFQKTSSLDECIAKIKQETRHYAKRQLTWFRRDERINWIYIDKTLTIENIIEKCKKVIAF
ncbi:MAG: tRNA (adenosine(37)-N6)-dimethylallyltransferase MiaA [Oscillospiraceae bacterium]